MKVHRRIYANYKTKTEVEFRSWVREHSFFTGRGGGGNRGVDFEKTVFEGGWIGKSEQRKCEGDINEYYTELDIYFFIF